jgi:uncharacterized protein (TIGR02266 family)
VRHRSPRVVASCKVEFVRLGRLVTAVTEDISTRGVFVRTTDYLPVGDIVELSLTLPHQVVVSVVSRVAHILSEHAARALGRSAGMGLEFLERDAERREKLRLMLVDLVDELLPPKVTLPRTPRVLVADDSPRLLDRLSTVLGNAGFLVQVATNGADAFALCQTDPPEIVLTSTHMAVMDGWTLLRRLSVEPTHADLVRMVMSEDASELVRLTAFRLGASDFLQKPFTDEELCLRLGRFAGSGRAGAERAVLKGSIPEIGLATLLSLLEYERKSGVVTLSAGNEIARLFVADGRVVKVESPGPEQGARERLLRLLDWRLGAFEFTSCEVVGKDEVAVTTSALLLEHARLRDEGRRRS